MNTLPTIVAVVNGFGLGLRLPIGKLLTQFFAHWQITV
jgi:hypothetical protein